MAKKRTVILLRGDGANSLGVEPLGALSAVRADLNRFNIAPDGSGPQGMGERLGTGVFFGPGMILEVPLNADDGRAGSDPDIAQILVSVTDEDFAWPVLLRLCKEIRWKMMDPDSGRTFG